MVHLSTSRRTFCSALAGAGAAAFAVPPGDKIRVAMIGTGHGHAASKVKALRALPEYEFVGICRPTRTNRRKRSVQDVRWMSLDEVIGDKTIEMVAVESYPGRNLTYAQKCVRAGKFVHLDKPPGRTWRLYEPCWPKRRSANGSSRWATSGATIPVCRRPSRLPEKAGSGSTPNAPFDRQAD